MLKVIIDYRLACLYLLLSDSTIRLNSPTIDQYHHAEGKVAQNLVENEVVLQFDLNLGPRRVLAIVL